MSAPPHPPGPGPDANAGEPRASTVLVGTVVALLAVVAVVAIVSGGGAEPAPSSVDAEERAIERASRGGSGAGPAVGERTEVARSSADAGVRGGPEGGVASVATAEPPASGGVASAAPAPSYVPPPPGVRGPITLEQEYEATAFFLDMLVLRRDTVRRDLEEARRIGDGPRIRRLAPDEAVLDADIARMVTRSHELEARLRARAEEEAGAEPPSGAPEGL